MESNITTKREVAPVFQRWIEDPNTKLPSLLGEILTPLLPDLGKLTVIHPTTNDPVIVSEKLGSIALWFTF